MNENSHIEHKYFFKFFLIPQFSLYKKNKKDTPLVETEVTREDYHKITLMLNTSVLKGGLLIKCVWVT